MDELPSKSDKLNEVESVKLQKKNKTHTKSSLALVDCPSCTDQLCCMTRHDPCRLRMILSPNQTAGEWLDWSKGSILFRVEVD